MTQKLTDELRTFCETTSVRGIPRIFKAKTRLTFVVWILGVLTCAGVLTWQLSVVIVRYLKFPVTTLSSAAPCWQRPRFPDVSVCNLWPLVYEREFKYKDYLNRVNSDLNNLLPFYNASGSNVTGDESPRQATFDALRFLSMPTTYLNHFPINESFSLDDSPILNCSYFDWTGTAYERDCLAGMAVFWDPTYYKCFTLRLLNDTDRSNIRGVSAILYVDSGSAADDVENFELSLDTAQATGLRMRIHDSRAYPDLSQAMNLGPGTATSVLLSQTKKVRLAYPYSNCTDAQHVPGDASLYTRHHCIVVCLQQRVVERCGCVGSSVPQYSTGPSGQLSTVNFTVCGNASRLDFYESYTCMRGLVTNTEVNDACQNACVQPCKEQHYDAMPSVAPWPQPAVQAAFFRSYVQQRPRFEDLSSPGNASGFITSRFLQVSIQFSSTPDFSVSQSVAAFTFDSMGAQIGGVLSLWLGVTVMFVFETFEFIYVYLINYYRQGRAVRKDGKLSRSTSVEMVSPSVAAHVE